MIMKIREEIDRIKSIMNLTEFYYKGYRGSVLIEPEIRGVTYELDDYGDYWELYELIVHGKHEKGLGSRFMRKLTQLADEHRKIVFTQASSAMGSDLNRLINFYERFGFEIIETPLDNETLQVMRRDPKS